MHIIRGKVRNGNKRGKRLGFPTANIRLHRKITQGIYISETLLENKKFPSVSFVGNAKTFGEDKIQLETHILSFARNIYDMWISVSLLKKIRPNQKFGSEESLREQIEKDIEEARKYFNETT